LCPDAERLEPTPAEDFLHDACDDPDPQHDAAQTVRGEVPLHASQIECQYHARARRAQREPPQFEMVFGRNRAAEAKLGERPLRNGHRPK